ncbi:MAG: M23 family metallopeptidase [Alphaproteobacteria bacterium]|nr:M23 family metallopeptidase [Alphaproteobacteria bacterium]
MQSLIRHKFFIIGITYLCLLSPHAYADTNTQQAGYLPSYDDAKFYDAGDLKLYGVPYQGGWLKGRLPEKHQLQFLGKTIKTTNDGRFIIGIPYQASALLNLVHIKQNGDRKTYQINIKQRKYKRQYIDGLPPSKVTPSKKFITRIKHEANLTKKVRANISNVDGFDTKFIWPLKGRITGRYGSQRILNGQQRSPHWGIDIAAKKGTPIIAPANGIVKLVHPDMYFSGKTIMIDHGHGLVSSFLHLHKIYVNHGAYVKRGQEIGSVGSSGRSTGPHLDWRVSWYNQRIDAATLVPKKQ